ncbi:hypothetical protein RB594_001110 [Gaeumannomyces avenae]
MKLRIAALLAGLGIAATARVQDDSITRAIVALPPCALPCAQLATQASKCLSINATNTACICTEPPTIDTFAGCVKLSCPLQDLLSTTKIFKDACGAPVRDAGHCYTIQQVVLCTISGLTVLLRLLSKILSSDTEGGMSTLGADDLTILLAYVLLLPKMYLCGVLMTGAGLGRDVWTLTTHQLRDYAFYWYFAEPIYFAVASLMRISITLFFMRVFTGRGLKPTFIRGRGSFRLVLWGTLAANTVVAVAFVAVGLAQCAPVSFYWNQYDGSAAATGGGGGRCIDGSALVWANAGAGIAMGAWMLTLPLSQIAGLNLSRRRRAQVGGMFCVGLFATAVSAARLRVLGGFSSDNPTWDQLPVAVWSALEMHAGIVCACLPAMRVALARTLPDAVSLGVVTVVEGEGAAATAALRRSQHQPLNPRRLSKPLPPLPRNSMSSLDGRTWAAVVAGGRCAEDSDSDKTVVEGWQPPHPRKQASLSPYFTIGRPDGGRRLTPDFFAVSYPSVKGRGK